MSNLPWTPSILDQVALVLLKQGVLEKSEQTLILGGLVGAGAYYSMAVVIKRSGLSLGNGMWNLLSTLSGTAIGTLVYSEKLSQKQVLGLLLGCVSLYLLDGVNESEDRGNN